MSLIVNGERRDVSVDPGTPLLWVLRDELKLVGTKFGCGIAQCGACTVQVGGIPTRSCSVRVGDLAGHVIQTIEGLPEDAELHPLQKPWTAESVPQCGYCQSGQLMTAEALLRAVPDPTDDDIAHAMSGNICRCGTDVRIKKAIKRAAAEMNGTAVPAASAAPSTSLPTVRAEGDPAEAETSASGATAEGNTNNSGDAQ